MIGRGGDVGTGRVVAVGRPGLVDLLLDRLQLRSRHSSSPESRAPYPSPESRAPPRLLLAPGWCRTRRSMSPGRPGSARVRRSERRGTPRRLRRRRSGREGLRGPPEATVGTPEAGPVVASEIALRVARRPAGSMQYRAHPMWRDRARKLARRNGVMLVIAALLVATAVAFVTTQREKLTRSPITDTEVSRTVAPGCECAGAVATIAFRLRQEDALTVSILDERGEPVRTLARNEQFPPGEARFEWDGRSGRGKSSRTAPTTRASDSTVRIARSSSRTSSWSMRRRPSRPF